MTINHAATSGAGEGASVILPIVKRGRRTAAAQARYDAELEAFYDAILKIRSRLDFQVSARGWCYLMEQQGAITKAEFNQVENLINEARKSGALPLDICAVDETRSFDCLESVDNPNLDGYLNGIEENINLYLDYYQPFSFWEDKPVYLEMLVEKIDLKSLFNRICRPINLPIANAKGWPDIHVRATMMRRFQKQEKAGKQCVLLYCGDYDPAGLRIGESYRDMFRDIRSINWSPDHLIIDRFGLNRDFIDQHHLTWIDNLITGSGKDLADSKHPDHSKPYVQDYIKANWDEDKKKCLGKVEANALVVVPGKARALCKAAIEKYVGSMDTAMSEFQSRLEIARKALKQRYAERLQANDEDYGDDDTGESAE
jgi:hypothetical protein